MVVAHAPNHRRIKGTDELPGCVERLSAEGLPVRVDLLSGRSNEDVRKAIRSADVVADQFIAGYAMFAIEGMAAGKPVLSALGWMPPRSPGPMRSGAARSWTPTSSNSSRNLRRLIADAGLRRELGRSGREFALSHHSYDAVASGWEAVIDHLWRGRPLPRGAAVSAGAERGGSSPGRVLYVGQSYYNAWYLSRELRKLGWKADVLNWDPNPASQMLLPRRGLTLRAPGARRRAAATALLPVGGAQLRRLPLHRRRARSASATRSRTGSAAFFARAPRSGC